MGERCGGGDGGEGVGEGMIEKNQSHPRDRREEAVSRERRTTGERDRVRYGSSPRESCVSKRFQWLFDYSSGTHILCKIGETGS
jgi:hypothetical protein